MTWLTERLRSHGLAYLAFTFFAIAAIIPSLVLALYVYGDGTFHIRWQVVFSEQFWQGDLDPRWMMRINRGFGSPTFFFYMPMAQWVASLFAPLLSGPWHAGDRVALSLGVSLLVSAIGAYHWLSDVTGDRRAGAFGAAVYMVAPYHLFVDIYLRMAVGEAWGMAFFPWVMLGIRRAADRANGGLALIFGVTGLLLSHVPSVLLCVIPASVYALWILVDRGTPALLIRYGACAAIGFMLAAFHVLTATQFEYVQMGYLFSGRQQPWLWLFDGSVWPDTAMQKAVVTLLVGDGALFALAMAAIWRLTRDRTLRRNALGGVGLAALAVLLQSPLVGWLWKLETPLSKVQFPWRAMMFEGLGLAVVAACLMAAVGQAERLRRDSGRLRALPVMVVALSLLIAFDGAMLFYRMQRMAVTGTRPYSEIIDQLIDDAAYRQGRYEALSEVFGNRLAMVERGRGTVVVTGWAPRRITVQTDFGHQGGDVLLRQFRFTGWQARIDGGPPVAADGPNIAGFHAPAGRHEAVVTMPPNAIERLGRILGLVGLALLVPFVLLNGRFGSRVVRARR